MILLMWHNIYVRVNGVAADNPAPILRQDICNQRADVTRSPYITIVYVIGAVEGKVC